MFVLCFTILHYVCAIFVLCFTMFVLCLYYVDDGGDLGVRVDVVTGVE